MPYQPEEVSLPISNLYKLKKKSVAKTRNQWKLLLCDNFIKTKNIPAQFR